MTPPRRLFVGFSVHSLSDVARLCGTRGFTGQRSKLFTAYSISKILRNPVYCGYRVFEGQLKPVQTPVKYRLKTSMRCSNYSRRETL
ncbi:recombinase family protein [Ruminococcus champanellensis]|uniref:recombinase family protein n=1 Tax=Ruminococcus champanellensis TaxID=1161942 RepID=UPI00349F3DEE